VEQYFNDVVSSLSLDDMRILSILFDNEASAGFRAMKNIDIQNLSGLSESTYRRCVNRLRANKFIETFIGKKQHSLYVTHYGTQALKISLEGVGI
jgi:DNA-binding IclR family transcriptional regulator